MLASSRTTQPPWVSILCDSLDHHSKAHLKREDASLHDMGSGRDASFTNRNPHQQLLLHVVSNENISSRSPDHYSTTKRIVSTLEAAPRPFLHLGFKKIASYHFFFFLGTLFAITLTVPLTMLLGYSLWVTLCLHLAVALLSLGYIKVMLLITGKDAAVFFYYLLLQVAGLIFLLAVLNQPIIPYLEILSLGFGVLLACTKIGCFMAGCCYGKPYRFGIRYTDRHKKNGFPLFFLSVRILPVQLLESVWLFFSTGLCSVLVFLRPPGVALSTFFLLLGVGRFILELLRGDVSRPYFGGLSQTQWISILMMVAIFVFEIINVLPYTPWHILFLCFTGVLIVYAHLRTASLFSISPLFSSDHIHELAYIFDIFKKSSNIPVSPRNPVHLRETSCGIQLSEGILFSEAFEMHHLTISSLDTRNTTPNLLRLLEMFQNWFPYYENGWLYSSNEKVHHLIYTQIKKGAYSSNDQAS